MGDDPRHRQGRHGAVRRERRREGHQQPGAAGARRSSGRRTARSSRAPASRTFFFVPTGDTDAKSDTFPRSWTSGATGARSSAFTCQATGTAARSTCSRSATRPRSFDNTNFLTKNMMLVTEDRGDGLHTQLNTLDSIWAYDVSKSSASAKRFLALGRDPASETDSNIGALACLATTPPSCGFNFQNEGDNEPTGLFASDGDTSKVGSARHERAEPRRSGVLHPAARREPRLADRREVALRHAERGSGHRPAGGGGDPSLTADQHQLASFVRSGLGRDVEAAERAPPTLGSTPQTSRGLLGGRRSLRDWGTQLGGPRHEAAALLECR